MNKESITVLAPVERPEVLVSDVLREARSSRYLNRDLRYN